tara:strand:- start:7746 stop:8864 length:1119 start_codon:yes stop_codon:yes gene_type:complete
MLSPNSKKEVPMKGRMAYMDEPGRISIREYDLPKTVEPGAALLEVIQTNVCGSEIHIFNGHHPTMRTGGLGHEMIGRIVELGEGTETDGAGQPIQVGDRVVPVYTINCMKCPACLKGYPSHCEHTFTYFMQQDTPPYFHGATFATHYYLHPGQFFFKVPDTVADGEAAAANCALSQVMVGIDVADVKAGQNVVIQGAGGLGLNACAVAKDRGATVIIIDPVPLRLELAREFGADHVIDLSEHNSSEARVQHIRDLTDGWGPDVVIEVTGVSEVIPEGLDMIGVGGTYVLIGSIGFGHPCDFDPAYAVRKLIKIVGVNRYHPKYLHGALKFLERTKDRYPFGRLLDKCFSLDEVQEAIESSARREFARATIVP